MRMLRSFAVFAAACACAGLAAAPAAADQAYHSQHIALEPVAGATLRNGFVENIHPNGPNVFAHEIYVLNGAAPNTTYDVAIAIWATNTSCSGAPDVAMGTATIDTNPAGNGKGQIVFTPADADGLIGLTVSVRWSVSIGSTVAYESDCEVVTLA